MLVYHATVPIDRERRKVAIDMAAEMAAASRAEDGVIDYRVAVDVDDPNVLHFFEVFPDEAGFEAHLEADHYLTFMDELGNLRTGALDVTRFDVSGMEAVEW